MELCRHLFVFMLMQQAYQSRLYVLVVRNIRSTDEKGKSWGM